MEWIVNDPTVAIFASLFVALILAAAAIPKLRNQDEFLGVVANYKLLPAFLVSPFAKVLPWLELGCAIALLVPTLHVMAASVAAGLFILFSFAIAVNVGRGRTHIDCGCVRRPTSMSRIGMFHVLRALALAGLSLYVVVVPLEISGINLESVLTALASAIMLSLIYMGADMMVGFPAAKNKLEIYKGNSND
ncbi:MauE/DoxX family redox-associated membrane protein [Methylophilus methylotrophus]|uniref:MauE/DoxX family redox-associated membrane protein n=1 Tax=Methylophilus methylotrophus TaxID=17 RepID=UPI0003A7206B|nr:MauE/DoxX family redox-associated membrane protein [Methylophilus methylotrophus]